MDAAPEAPASVESSVPETSAAQGTAPTPAPEAPTPPSFDWSSWNGDASALPEEAQYWAKGASEWQEKRVQETQAQLDQLREFYQRMVDADTDPRIAELDGRNKELVEQLEAQKAQAAEARKQIEEWQAAEQQREEAKIEAKLTEFRENNDFLFDGGENEKLASELYAAGEGWDMELLPALVKMPTGLRNLCNEIKQGLGEAAVDKGVQELVLQRVLAQARKNGKSHAPSFVAGSDRANTAASKPAPPDVSKMSPGEIIRLRAREYLNAAGTARR